MKYLKAINEYNSDSLIEDLKDISLELDDVGYSADVYKAYDNTIIIGIYIKDSKPGQISNFNSELIDFIIRCNNYMSSNGWHGTYTYSSNGLNKKFYIKGDRLRTGDIQWIDDKWPTFSFLNLKFKQ